MLLIIALILSAYRIIPQYQNSLLLFVLLLVPYSFIEYAPIGFRRFMIHFYKKEEIAKGNIFRGDVEIKIEK